MDACTSGEVANLLHVSLPTIRRTAKRLGLGACTTEGGHLRFSPADVEVLVSDLGRIPLVEGLSRTQVQVLAALAAAPFGLQSERAVARAGRVSPTAAGRALEALLEAALVRREPRTVAEGRARETNLWCIERGPKWRAIASAVTSSVLPRATRVQRPEKLPRRFWHLFWNADPAALDLDVDADYIATRMLLSDDLQAVAWVCAHLPARSLRHAALNRAADLPTRSMVDNVLAAS